MSDAEETVKKKYFTMLALSSGMNMIGVVDEDAMEEWGSGSYMRIEQPKMLMQIQVSEKSVQIVPAPIFPIKTEQSEMLVFPEVVNIIGEVVEDERTNTVMCQGEDKLFPAYQDAIRQWKTELSGIEIVGANGMPKNDFPTGDAPPGVIPFPQK